MSQYPQYPQFPQYPGYAAKPPAKFGPGQYAGAIMVVMGIIVLCFSGCSGFAATKWDEILQGQEKEMIISKAREAGTDPKALFIMFAVLLGIYAISSLILGICLLCRSRIAIYVSIVFMAFSSLMMLLNVVGAVAQANLLAILLGLILVLLHVVIIVLLVTALKIPQQPMPMPMYHPGYYPQQYGQPMQGYYQYPPQQQQQSMQQPQQPPAQPQPPQQPPPDQTSNP